MKTLRDLTKPDDKKPQSKAIPSVFAGEGDFQIVGGINPVAVPKSRRLAGEKGHFAAPLGNSSEDVARRALAYGTLLSGRREYVPYALDDTSRVDGTLVRSMRTAVGVSVMNDAGVKEVHGRKMPKMSDGNAARLFIQALSAVGSHKEAYALRRTKSLLKKRGFLPQAEMLIPLIKTTIKAARMKEDITVRLQFLHEFFRFSGPIAPAAPKKSPDSAPGPASASGDHKFVSGESAGGYTPVAIPATPAAETLDSAAPACTSVPDDPEEKLPWGEMETLYPPLQVNVAQKKTTSKKWKRAQVGAFRYPWRALKTSDLQCFALKRRTYGGTLLFDMSGSMRLTIEQIREILERSPQATMAAYGSHPANTYTGRLVIVAKDGRVANANNVRRLIGAGNVVDGPALEWLGSMPEPRVWVSDGDVTGKGDQYYGTKLRDFADTLQKQRKIHRISSASELIRLLKS